MSQNFKDQDQGFQDPNKEKDKRYPYDEGKKTMHDNIIDPQKNIIYQEKHWKPIEDLKPELVDSYRTGKSPLTKMIEGGVCEGVLHITGSFFNDHKEEIINAIKHSDEMAQERDTMNRVINILRMNEEEIAIFTSKNQLAVTIGKKLDSAFKGGNLDITWSKGEKEVEVKWQKDKE